MNIFFYASAESVTAKQFAQQLLSRDSLSAITVLPGGSRLKSGQSLKLRNGDVLILFASTDKELEELLAIHDKFEEFRIILILPCNDTQIVAMSHRLKPRFITFMDNDITNIEKVINKMRG